MQYTGTASLKQIAEAAAAGLEIVGDVPYNGVTSKVYRFKCGHENIWQVSHVSVGTFRCRTCYPNKQDKPKPLNWRDPHHQPRQEIAFPQGLTYLWPTRTNYGEYLADCGHVLELQHQHVKRNNWKCVQCKKEQLRQAAHLFNHDLLDNIQSKALHTFVRHRDCGNSYQMLDAAILNRKTDKCDFCFKKAMIEDFERTGIEEIEQLDKNYFNVRFKCCGHEMRASRVSSQRQTLLCPSCKPNGMWDTKSYLYAIKVFNENEAIVKLGYANNVLRRISEFKIAPEYRYEIVASTEIPTRRMADQLETTVHSTFANYRLTPQEGRKFLTSTGYTECFRIECMEEAIRMIDKEKNYG